MLAALLCGKVSGIVIRRGHCGLADGVLPGGKAGGICVGAFITTQRIWMRFFVIDRVIQKDGLFVYKIHNIIEKTFIISTRAKPGRVDSHLIS
jgi:hypothetical protein